jgi:crotonobetainyl-CoA:carnitine CoA-transferase CaiB-like acyl-CoA transferase
VVTVADGGRTVPQVRSPIRIDGQMLTPRSAPPLLGADDAGVRDALGPVVA